MVVICIDCVTKIALLIYKKLYKNERLKMQPFKGIRFCTMMNQSIALPLNIIYANEDNLVPLFLLLLTKHIGTFT